MIAGKRIAALALAAVMAGSLAACSTGEDTKWVAKSGDMTIPAGVYLTQLVGQYSSEATKLSEEDQKDPMKAKIDGRFFEEVVVENARNDLSKYIAVENKFDEMKLNLSEDEIAITNDNVDQFWDYSLNPYDSSSKTLGDTYQANGISKESYKLCYMNDTKREQIFQAIYGEGGTEEVSESELKEKFTKDVSKVVVIPLTFSSDEDATKKAEADKKTRDLIDKYLKLAKDGGDMEDLVYEAEKEVTRNDELEKPEKGSSFTFVTKDQSPYADNVTDAIFNAKVGEPFVAETETSIYLFERYDVNEKPDDFTARKDSMLRLLKNDEFDANLLKWAGELSDVSYNDKAFSRYSLNKLKLK